MAIGNQSVHFGSFDTQPEDAGHKLTGKDFGIKKNNETAILLKDKYLFSQKQYKLPIKVEYSFTFKANTKNNASKNDLIAFWSEEK